MTMATAQGAPHPSPPAPPQSGMVGTSGRHAARFSCRAPRSFHGSAPVDHDRGAAVIWPASAPPTRCQVDVPSCAHALRIRLTPLGSPSIDGLFRWLCRRMPRPSCRQIEPNYVFSQAHKRPEPQPACAPRHARPCTPPRTVMPCHAMQPGLRR